MKDVLLIVTLKLHTVPGLRRNEAIEKFPTFCETINFTKFRPNFTLFIGAWLFGNCLSFVIWFLGFLLSSPISTEIGLHKRLGCPVEVNRHHFGNAFGFHGDTEQGVRKFHASLFMGNHYDL